MGLPPIISSALPQGGPLSGATRVTIRGEGAKPAANVARPRRRHTAMLDLCLACARARVTRSYGFRARGVAP